jgi:hypothetical protein
MRRDYFGVEPVRSLCQISALEVSAHEKEADHDREKEVHIWAGRQNRSQGFRAITNKRVRASRY